MGYVPSSLPRLKDAGLSAAQAVSALNALFGNYSNEAVRRGIYAAYLEELADKAFLKARTAPVTTSMRGLSQATVNELWQHEYNRRFLLRPAMPAVNREDAATLLRPLGGG